MRASTLLPRRAAWPAIAVWAMFMAVALPLAGCAGATSPRTARAPSPTASPMPTLAWRTVSPPSGVVLASGESSSGATFAISPLDGRYAWLCAPTATAGSFAIWATADAGASWHRAGTLAPTTPQAPSCTLIPDQLDPQVLAAGLTWGCGECGTLASSSYFSGDGGATWQPAPGETAISEIASRAGLSVALLRGAARSQSGIAVSTDGLRTWHLSNPAGLAANDSLFQFWLNSTSREVLAASLGDTLWRSPDGGATWARVNTPATQITLGAWIPAAPAHWLLCGGGPANTTELLCSADLGATWTPRPLYTDTYTCSNCGKWGAPSGGTDTCVTNVMTTTGALLAACPPNGTAPDPTHPDAPANFALYRLTPGATTWTDLGAAPGPWLTLPATGPLWCWNAQQGILATTTLPSE